jgi:hypothetical protein
MSDTTPSAAPAPAAKPVPAVPPVSIDRAVLRAAIRADARWIMEELNQTLAGADTAAGNPIDG